MRPGDRVLTDYGPGTITRIHTHTQWIFGRPLDNHYFYVRLDSNPTCTPMLLSADQIKEEEPMPDTDPDTTTVVDPTQPDPQPEPTEPDTDEPEPDTNGDEDEDTKNTRRVVITEDEVELVEWP